MSSSDSSFDPSDWEKAAASAEREIERALEGLPPKLRSVARQIPVVLEARPNRDLVNDGIEPDTLGLFVGGEFADGDHCVMPPQIILFLENLWEAVEGDPEAFLAEVRTTLLHELGHYLGLDEDDLEERGLE